ncbi:hypothetical protein BDY17DRAFT_303901 [Neohortaea acidophila]|uniref:Uncharacterized protein n=1 Tax=Neohortaea acidophila TaxID=245834 RepID=A0A6A6PI38_9PEZI|nr:uncharacterized protein BDY17DRAFT_303901 [Neohortaea acidophila]KAF2479456.1 hypothetical protein BDY17DRAFT_303901 [Neohortaea acidophila]
MHLRRFSSWTPEAIPLQPGFSTADLPSITPLQCTSLPRLNLSAKPTCSTGTIPFEPSHGHARDDGPPLLVINLLSNLPMLKFDGSNSRPDDDDLRNIL